MTKNSLRFSPAAIAALMLGTAPVQAVTYYVSNSGNDSSAGTSSLKPWKTLSKANSRLLPGDTVLVMPGTYAETIDPGSSGTYSAPITYKAYSANNKPKIVGRGTAPSSMGAVVNLDGEFVVVDGFALKQAQVISDTSYNALVKGSYNTLRNNVFQNPRTDLDVQCKLDRQMEYAISIDGTGHLLENNTVERFCNGITVGGSQHAIRGNTVRYILFDALKLNSAMDMIVEDNAFYDHCSQQGVCVRFTIVTRPLPTPIPGGPIHVPGPIVRPPPGYPIPPPPSPL